MHGSSHFVLAIYTLSNIRSAVAVVLTLATRPSDSGRGHGIVGIYHAQIGFIEVNQLKVELWLYNQAHSYISIWLAL